MTLVPRVTKLLAEQGMADVLVTVGGIIPDDDVAALKAAGVAEVFGPGTTIAAGRRLPAVERASARVGWGRPPGPGRPRSSMRRSRAIGLRRHGS